MSLFDEIEEKCNVIQKEAERLRKKVQKEADRLEEEAFNAFGASTGSRERPLKPSEIAVAKQVFLDSITWSEVRISDGHGRGNSVFTNAGIGKDTIYMTGAKYANPPNDTLIHELTHVWQGTHEGLTGLGYKADSLLHQGFHIAMGHGRNAAYAYDRGALGSVSWSTFTAEQQAAIVEDWFKNGKKQSDPAYPYIYWCIQRLQFVGDWWKGPPPPVR